MQPERWKETEEIFNLPMECNGSKRVEFLEEACAGDAELSGEVKSLIYGDV